MIEAIYTTKDILDQLDDCARNFIFPMLDNGYVYPAGVRLSAYRDHLRWALIIEDIGSNFRAGGHYGMTNCLYCFGNSLRRSPGTANEDFLSFTEDGESGATFDDGWDVNENISDIKIRGKSFPLHINNEIMEAKGINLIEEGIALHQPERLTRITGADLLRLLVLEYRDELLATDEELEQRLLSELPIILRLNEWNHPLVNEELPSQSETFQMIAEVLVSGDVARYQPTKPPNTHWRNWPDGGTL